MDLFPCIDLWGLKMIEIITDVITKETTEKTYEFSKDDKAFAAKITAENAALEAAQNAKNQLIDGIVKKLGLTPEEIAALRG